MIGWERGRFLETPAVKRLAYAKLPSEEVTRAAAVENLGFCHL